MKSKRTPIIHQMSPVECGPSCLAMVLSSFKRATTVTDLSPYFGGGRDGVSASALVRAARKEGLDAQGCRITADGLGSVQTPFITHWDRRHFVVVETVRRSHIRIVDPAIGRLRMAHEEFWQHSSGICIEFQPSATFQRRRRSVRERPLTRISLDTIVMAGRAILVVLACTGLVQGLTLLGALASKYAIDSVIATNGLTLGTLASALALGLLVFVTVNFSKGMALALLQQKLDRRMNERFMRRLLSLPFAYFQTRSTGDLLTRLGSNSLIRELLTSQLLSLIIDSLFVMGYGAVLIMAAPSYALAICIFGAVEVLLVGATWNRVQAITQSQLAAQTEVASEAVELIQGIEFLKSAGLASASLRRWLGLLGKELDASRRRRRLDAVNDTILSSLQLGAQFSLLFLGVTQVLAGRISVGDMVALGALSAALMQPVNQFLGSLRHLQTMGSHLQRIYDVLDNGGQQPPPLRAAGPSTPVTAIIDIELSGVSFTYPGAPRPAISDVSLRLRRGKKIAIVGRSGSGKTTLLRVLTGLMAPTEGAVCVNGLRQDGTDWVQAAGSFGLVTQNPFVIGGTVRENLTFGQTAAVEDEGLYASLTCVGLYDDVRAMPLGLDTYVGEGGLTLSGGQRQRLCLARAVLSNPGFLVLDEATSHLDSITEQEVSQNLANRGIAQVMVAHRLSSIMASDEILVLAEGKIVERGTHEELLALGGHYAALARMQAIDIAQPG